VGLLKFGRRGNEYQIFSSRKSLWMATKKSMTEMENETIKLFLEICRFCYQLIEGICQENYSNQIECFKYFNIFKRHVFIYFFCKLKFFLMEVGHHMGATSCLISVLKSNEKLLWLIHSNDSDMENYSSLLKMRTREGNERFLKNSFKLSSESTIIHYFLERYEVNIIILFKSMLKSYNRMIL
jgi:hypothetical protein